MAWAQMAAGAEKEQKMKENDKPWFLDDSQVIGSRNCVIFLGFLQGSKIQAAKSCRVLKQGETDVWE